MVYNAPMFEFQNKVSAFDLHTALTFCYVGTIYPGWQDPSPFDMVSFCGKREFQIIFCFRNAGNFFALSEKYGVRQFIDYRGAVSREDSLALQQQADILLLLESTLQRLAAC